MKVVLASLAEVDVLEADAWWRQHRDEKNLFEDELTASLGLLAASPGVGQRVSRSGLLVRRLTLRKTAHLLFYSVDAEAETVTVLRLWHASRGPRPW